MTPLSQSQKGYIILKPEDLKGKYDVRVKLDESMKKPVTSTKVIKTDNGWVFPEDVTLYSHNDEWLYAFGPIHVWRTEDPLTKEWELVK